MNKISPIQTCCLISLSAITWGISAVSAQAQISDQKPTNSFELNSVSINLESGFEVVRDGEVFFSEQINIADLPYNAQAQPMPGSVATSVDALGISERNNGDLHSQTNQSGGENTESTVAQNRTLIRDRYSVGSYIGAGVNIGFDGDTSLGDFGGVIFGKISLDTNVSLRPAAIIGSDVSFLIPVTYDFIIPGETPYVPRAYVPYAGAGLVISTEDDSNVGFLLTGGLDWHFSDTLVGNAQFNLGAIEDTVDVGITLGIGYKFLD